MTVTEGMLPEGRMTPQHIKSFSGHIDVLSAKKTLLQLPARKRVSLPVVAHHFPL